MSEFVQETKQNSNAATATNTAIHYLSTNGPTINEIHSGKRIHIANALKPVPLELHPFLHQLTDTHNHMCGFTPEEQSRFFCQSIENNISLPGFQDVLLAKQYMIVSTDQNDWNTFLNYEKNSSNNNTGNHHNKFIFGYGIHPMNAKHIDIQNFNWIDTLRTCLIQSPHSFVGEIGLDKGRHKASYQSHQIPIFVQQMSLAAELNRPVSIHSVKTDSALIDLFDGMDKLPPALTLHSYCGSLETWKRIVAVIDQKSIQQESKCELFIGLNCVTNLCKKDLSILLNGIGLNSILIETDFSVADYPYDNANNRDISKLLLHAVEIIAHVFEEPYEVIVATLVKNTERFLKSIV